MNIELSICLIVKDEEENLDAALASVRGCADEIVVVDTGSTDRTVAVAERHGARVGLFTSETHSHAFFRDDEETCAKFKAPPPFSGEIMLGDFGAARRHSFAMARGEFCYWMDADDVVEGAQNLRAVVAQLRAQRLDMAFMPYDYARDNKDRTFYRQWRERIMRRDAGAWVNPVHEVFMPGRPVQSARFDGVTNVHRRKADRKSVPNRNYKILLRHHEQERAVGNVDPRTLFYLGQEARFIEPQRAAEFYEEYLRRSGWPEERAAAHVALGSLMEFGQLGGAPEEMYSRADREYACAAAEMPDNPDGLYGMARIAYLRGRDLDCVSYHERAQKIGNTESMLGANPLDRTYRPWVYVNHSLARLGRLEEAVAACKKGLEACPDDPGVPGGAPGMLKHNLAEYEAELARRRAPAPVMQPEAPQGMRLAATLGKDEDLATPPAPGIPKDALVIWAVQLWKQAVARDDADGARGVVRAAEWLKDDVVERMRQMTEARWPSRLQQALIARGADDDDRRSRVIAEQPGDLPSSFLVEKLDETRQIVREWMPPPASGGADFYLKMGRYRTNPNGEKKRIVFWTGPAAEPWDPTTPAERGIGGSETACVEMARELAARGHHVTVYGDLPYAPGDGKIFDGVQYYQWQSAASASRLPLECDVFISSRQPAVMERAEDVRAGVKLLWVHDIHVGDPTPQMERWLLRFDRMLCLSQWHKAFFLSVYPWLDPAKVIVTRNGIDPARFVCLECGGIFTCENECLGRGTKRRNRVITASSPNRGLDLLVTNWPHVRAKVPDAELHVYYGFDCWEAFARARGNQEEIASIERFKAFLAERAHAQSGIHLHGRVNQRELAEAYLRAKVWSHYTQFTETSCISAMEAQAAGCLAIHSGVAALAETVRHGVRVDSPQAHVDTMVRALIDEAWRGPIASAGREWALANLSWRALAAEWSEMFTRIAGELAADPLPKYVEVG